MSVLRRGSRGRSVGLRTGLALAAAVGVGWLGGGTAWATTGHSLAGQFGDYGTGDGQFNSPNHNGPSGVAVMASTGEVFTLSDEQGRVQRFSGDGVFQSAFAVDTTYGPVGSIAADPTGAGAVYVVGYGAGAPNAVLKYSGAGAFVHQLDAAGGGVTIGFSGSGIPGNMALAVDPVDGTVYVAATDDATGGQVIASFDQATGAFISSFDGSSNSPDGGIACPNGLAVDGSHRVYVLDTCKGRVDRYSAAGVFDGTVDDGSRGAVSAVAVNAGSDEVFVAEAGPIGLQVTHFTAGGAAPVYTFDASVVGGVRAMAVSNDGTVYTSDATNPLVERFTQFEGPTVTTGGSTGLEARSVTVEGTINPEGVDSSYHFEYGTDMTYGLHTAEVGVGSGSLPLDRSQVLDGLSPNTTYHYRIVGSNSSGSIAGADATFVTALAPPTMGTSPASAITPRSASIHGTVNAENSFALWHFEYGTTAAYGSSTASGLAGGGTAQAVVSDLAGLEPGTTYHYRTVAFGLTGGTQYGPDRTFITAPAAAAGASAVTTTRATLKGTVDPHGEATTYHFNYGPTAAYGTSTPEIDAANADGEQPVSHTITGLKPDTTYYVRVVATSGEVTRSGAEGVFRTAPAPTAAAISPTSITTSAATLAGEIDTHGLTGSYHFNVSSLNSSFTQATPKLTALGGSSAQRVTVPVSGLPAGETFVVELTVDSNESISVSNQITFATAALPRVFPTMPDGDVTSIYGCAAPIMDAYNKRPEPGETITISGRDLGTGGNVVLGDRSVTPTDWTATRFSLQLPEDVTGTLGLTINCGHRSNTIAIALHQQPDNRFTVTRRPTSGLTAALAVKLPGPGRLQSAATNTRATTTTVKKAGEVTIRVRLSNAGIRALRKAKSRRLQVTARVRFTPAGGRPATKTVTITYKRGR